MARYDVRLSVEELAFILTEIGQAEAARHWLISHLGSDLTQEQVYARMAAAGHSLIARNLLHVTMDATLLLAEPVAQIAAAVAMAEFSICYTRTYRDADFALTYHFQGGSIFEHQVDQGLVQQFTQLDAAEVIDGGIDFLDLPPMTIVDQLSAELPKHVLDNVKDQGETAAVARELHRAGLPAAMTNLLAEDLSRPVYRGTILRVEYDQQRSPYSERGLLVLRGPERLWLLRPFLRESQPYVTILQGTEQVFHQELSVLLGPTA